MSIRKSVIIFYYGLTYVSFLILFICQLFTKFIILLINLFSLLFILFIYSHYFFILVIDDIRSGGEGLIEENKWKAQVINLVVARQKTINE